MSLAAIVCLLKFDVFPSCVLLLVRVGKRYKYKALSPTEFFAPTLLSLSSFLSRF